MYSTYPHYPSLLHHPSHPPISNQSDDRPKKGAKVGKKGEEEEEDEEEEDIEDIDLDQTIEFEKLTSEQLDELDAIALNWGMKKKDFLSFLEVDQDEAETKRSIH